MFRDDLNGHGNGKPRRDPMALLGERKPPYNREAEEATLGGVLADPRTLDDMVMVLAADDFYFERHQIIYRAMSDMHGRGVPVDYVTLGEELARRGEFDRAGGLETLTALRAAVPHEVNALYHGKIVAQKAQSRRVVEACAETLDDAFRNEHTADELVDAAERRIYAVRDRRSMGQTVAIGDVMFDVMAAVQRRMDGEVSGLTTGITDLDEVTCGFQPENLVYVAGRTSMGKTALCLGIAHHLSVDEKRPGLYVSLEMSRAELGERLAVMRSRLDGHKVRTGMISPGELASLNRAAGEVAAAPLHIDDTAGRTASQIVANARRMKSREGIQYVVIDLITRVDGEDSRRERREQIGDASSRFKGLARELKIPVICLAQLNRQPDARDKHRPRKSDLKDCGNIEEDADLVILLHRPEYYDPGDCPGEAVVIVDKNRNGPTRDVKVTFQKKYMRFEAMYPGG